MDCYGFNNVISDYIDNNLSATERRQADLHLQECDECRDKLECMISMLDDLHHLPKICCCERFEDELMKKIHDYKTKKQRPVVAAMQQYSRYISLAAAMVLLVAASLFVYSSLNVESGGSSVPTADVRTAAPASQLPAGISGAANQSQIAGTKNTSKPDSVKKVIPNYNSQIKMVNE